MTARCASARSTLPEGGAHGYAMVQFVPADRRLKICVFDTGIGLKTSFAGSRYAPATSAEAIRMAVRKGVIADLYDYLCGTYNGCSVADISVSVANHLIGFAAERARHTDTVVDVDKYFAEFGLENNIK